MTQFEQLDLLLNEYGGIIQTFQAVSYTHLDVYKRQVWGNDINQSLYTVSEDGLITGDSIKEITLTPSTTAVSYTHLDVYKRQVLCCAVLCCAVLLRLSL